MKNAEDIPRLRLIVLGVCLGLPVLAFLVALVVHFVVDRGVPGASGTPVRLTHVNRALIYFYDTGATSASAPTYLSSVDRVLVEYTPNEVRVMRDHGLSGCSYESYTPAKIESDQLRNVLDGGGFSTWPETPTSHAGPKVAVMVDGSIAHRAHADRRAQGMFGERDVQETQALAMHVAVNCVHRAAFAMSGNARISKGMPAHEFGALMNEVLGRTPNEIVRLRLKLAGHVDGGWVREGELSLLEDYTGTFRITTSTGDGPLPSTDVDVTYELAPGGYKVAIEGMSVHANTGSGSAQWNADGRIGQGECAEITPGLAPGAP